MQTADTPENENPGALAGATGAEMQSVTVCADYNPDTRSRAIALADAAADCPQEIRARLLERLLDTFRPGWPIPAFMGRVMSEASFWADMASRAELKAYCLASFQRMPAADQAAFLAFISGRAAA